VYNRLRAEHSCEPGRWQVVSASSQRPVFLYLSVEVIMLAALLGLWALWTAVLIVVCALTGSYISAEKDRGSLEGMLLGGVFGPFGLLLAVLMPAPAKPVVPLFPPGMLIAALFAIIGLAVMTGIIVANQPAPSPAAQAVR
jgi:hypothetical protein